jgi:pyridoxamine 5'-phosphate oxidase
VTLSLTWDVLAKLGPQRQECSARRKQSMDRTLAAMREDYIARGLSEEEVVGDPIEQFERWFDDALRAEVHEPNAMTLATVDASGQPAARMVLLKAVDHRGLSFFTNFASRKSHELATNPRATLLFWWGPLARQVRFEGRVERVDDAEADAYFASRPRGSQIGAWASPQSSVIPGRAALERAERSFRERFADAEVPRPEVWGGFRLIPERVEFWQGRSNRLHDRLRYTRDGSDGWRIERLAP